MTISAHQVESVPDFKPDILDYLRTRRGTLVKTMVAISELTSRVKGRSKSRQVRGRLLSDLSVLIRDKKVIRYRKVTMVRRRPRSSQGLLRISEVFV